MRSDMRGMHNGEWRMENGECRMENAECRMQNLKCPHDVCTRHEGILHSPFFIMRYTLR